MRVGLPHIRTLVVREKTARDTSKKRFKAAAGRNPGKKSAKNAAVAQEQPGGAVAQAGEDPVSYFLGTRVPGPAEPFAQLIRGHWGGCEIRNHGTRDVQWLEDQTRSGNWKLNACLAILRAVLISVKFRNGVNLSWPVIFEQCAHSTASAIAMLNGKSIK